MATEPCCHEFKSGYGLCENHIISVLLQPKPTFGTKACARAAGTSLRYLTGLFSVAVGDRILGQMNLRFVLFSLQYFLCLYVV